MNKMHRTSRTVTKTVVGLLPDKKITSSAARARATPFTPQAFLTEVGHGKTMLKASKSQLIFSQGDAADAVFYLRAGRVKLSVLSQQGKEAVVGILEHGSFFGKGCLVGQLTCRATATALDASTILRIDKTAMIRVLHDEANFAKLFTANLLSHNVRIQKDLVDHLFNSTEKRLAQVLLLLAGYGRDGEPEGDIPKVSQETLAEMVGTTRSRVRLFLDEFRALGFIHYNGTIQVHRALLNIVLYD
jgi:CRP/FNR family transcriptional regulator, cyclic AMP receptor protein